MKRGGTGRSGAGRGRAGRGGAGRGAKTASLRDIVDFLDGELDTAGFDDSSANGLQVEGRGDVRCVGLAVDACMASFRAAARAEEGSDLLVVHHGLIWDGGIRAVTGVVRERLAFLLERGIGLYASHLPLDAHPKLGNNAGLARMMGLKKLGPFCRYHGREIAFAGELPRATTAGELARRMAKALSTSPTRPAETRVVGKASKRVRRVGVVSGGGSFALREAAEKRLDALFTGEGSHAAKVEAADSGVVVIYAGHYETETPGVKSLGAALRKRFGVKTVFVDVPQ